MTPPATASVDALLDVYAARGRRLATVRAVAREALTQPSWVGSHILARRILTILDTPDTQE